MNSELNNTQSTPIGKKNWSIILLLGLSGHIAWSVENSWFNTFIFDTITPDPKPIATMVAVSAIVATLTTLLMGTLSDRVGKRKPFIVIGYTMWALSTIAFPMSGWAGTVQAAILLVILLDVVMTFFGATANDAAFNAWVTDITDETNRGSVEGVMLILPVLAIMIGMGVSGVLIDTLGYFVFFLTLGGLVLCMGLAGSLMLEEGEQLTPQKDTYQKGYFSELISIFSLKDIEENKELYLAFLALAIFIASQQIVTPYELIYLNNHLGISKSTAGILTAVIAPVIILLAIPVGKLTDKGHGFKLLQAIILTGSLGQFLFALTGEIWLLIVLGVVKSTGHLSLIVLGAWARNWMPENARGQFQGVRVIFMVMLPMLIGPTIGSFVIEGFGTPTVLNGNEGFIPPPMIYQVSACVTLLTLIPIWLLKDKVAS